VTFRFLGPDPLDELVKRALDALAEGAVPGEVESSRLEVKEEPGRRDRDGAVLEGHAENDPAARYLADEIACLANTAGGGALVVGIANDGTRIGTNLDAEWLRHRIWQITDQRLTITVETVELDDSRLLVLKTHEAIEPIRVDGRIKWRVDDNCVEVDPTSWHAGRMRRAGVDWSAQPSGHSLADVRTVALEVARRFLNDAGDEAASDLAAATDEDLLRRLHVVDGEGRLTNAGSLLFVSTPEIGVEYIRRDVPAGDSLARFRGTGPLLEQMWDIDKASAAANRTVHVPQGLAHGLRRAIPPGALREAIVNGVVHRDWNSPQPTTIEHVGDVVTVTSPGGFIGGIGPTNIITHPAVPRYRSLAEAMATLRLAEREGIGVDRIVRDMLAVGRPRPEIGEIPGPYVQVCLLGGDPDPALVGFFAALQPPATAADLDALLIIDHLTHHGWIDAERAEPVLQRRHSEATAALERLSRAQLEGEPVVVAVAGVPSSGPPAWRLSDAARAPLSPRCEELASPDGRRELILAWARARGRVSSTEVADLTRVSAVYAGQLLGGFEADGKLAPGRPNRRGRGFYYVPTHHD
jgi:ATP-dependent DNA helicase RecG